MGSSSRLRIPILVFGLLLCSIIQVPCCFSDTPNKSDNGDENNQNKNNVKEIVDEGQFIEVKSAPEDVVWVVQLSDLHFSVHHPERAQDFKSIVGPTLSMINPSLVLMTGDLTGKFCLFYFFHLLGQIYIFAAHNFSNCEGNV